MNYLSISDSHPASCVQAETSIRNATCKSGSKHTIHAHAACKISKHASCKQTTDLANLNRRTNMETKYTSTGNQYFSTWLNKTGKVHVHLQASLPTQKTKLVYSLYCVVVLVQELLLCRTRQYWSHVKDTVHVQLYIQPGVIFHTAMYTNDVTALQIEN